MAKGIGQGSRERPRDFLRVGVRERPAKSPRSSRKPPPPAQEEEQKTRCAERARPEEDRVRSLRERPAFRSPASFLPRSEQGAGASSSPPSARPGEEHTHPFRSQMAKVELERLYGKWFSEGVSLL
jgi:hypothetical protein